MTKRHSPMPIPSQVPEQGVWCHHLTRRREAGPSISPPEANAFEGMSTLAVHGGQYDDPVTGAIGTPIFQNTTYYLAEEGYRAIGDGRAREHFIYSRYGNPSQWAVQQKIAGLEGAESAVVLSSGMAAITSAVMALADKGSHIITSRDLYGGTYNFFHEDLFQWGMSVSFVEPTDLDAIAAAIRPETKLFFFESLTNPLLKLVSLPKLVSLAKQHGIRTIVDNTFLSPINLRPLDWGVDLVLHSASKYLNGHSDLTAGVVSGSRKLVDLVWAQMLKLGGMLDPHACFLLERGLKTLALRMQAHNYNASALGQFLARREEVLRVLHPSLPTYPQACTAAQMLKGSGGVIAFEIKGGNPAAHRFVDHLKLPKQATSLGGVESLVSLPYNTSHASLMPQQLRQVGIRPGLVRLSVGIEDLDDLKRDIHGALLHSQGANTAAKPPITIQNTYEQTQQMECIL